MTSRFFLPAILFFGLLWAGCDSSGDEPEGEVVATDIVIGEGTIEIQPGHTLIVTFDGRLPDGTQFSHSDELGGTFTFTLGVGMVLDGWDTGLVGMREGGTRRLEIPAHLAFGSQGLCLSGEPECAVPPNTDVTYDVTLVEIFDDVKVSDIEVGDGLEAQIGDLLAVEYQGTLPQYDDRLFGSSNIDGSIFVFHLGADEVIDGWDLGLVGMKAGGVRNLLIPPHLGYGGFGAGGGSVPPWAVLEFRVSLVVVEKPPEG